MNSKLAVPLATVVIVLIAAAFLISTQSGATSSTSVTSTSTSTTTQSTTSIGTGGNSLENLQLQLSVNASSTGGSGAKVTIQIVAREFNTLATANNVSKSTEWPLSGLSLGSCGTTIYPFGVAVYRGVYTAGNVSQATPLGVQPVVPCPMLIRYISGYVFQPSSDLAVILPGGTGATATLMQGNVTATTVNAMGANLTESTTPLSPGTYSVAAGDEWGSVVVVHFTIGSGTSTSTTATGTYTTGTLGASFSIGPTMPVCNANATMGPAPQPYASIEAVVNSSSGQVSTLPISWVSSGCAVMGVVQASLAPGSYSLNLSSCTYMGCNSALPKSFVIVAGQSTSVSVSIDTGIR